MSKEENKKSFWNLSFLCFTSLHYSNPFLYSNIFQLLGFVSIYASSLLLLALTFYFKLSSLAQWIGKGILQNNSTPTARNKYFSEYWLSSCQVLTIAFYAVYKLSLVFCSSPDIYLLLLNAECQALGSGTTFHVVQKRGWVRLCAASKLHLDGSVGSRASAPPARKAAAGALIYTQSDPTLLSLEAIHPQVFVLFQDET